MSVYVVIRRTFPKAFAGVVIALALPGSAWAQPASGDAPATMMLVPASPLVIGTPAFTPGELDIPAIGVSAVVTSVGTVMASAPFLGGQMVPTFAVPPDGSSVGWWADGPLVGAPGMAILLGHTQIGGYAVFNRLGELHPGDQVVVADSTGSARADFRVTRVVSDVPKNDPEALRRVLSENAKDAQLALITCGGAFNASYRASADNVVAFAAQV
ncbi:MAG: class F sortase [Mycobacterium sp.]|nr:class F sortase [Mycobacterium sp.]MCB0938662.1 class F sortase [Mycobacterium sp.]